MNKEKFYITTPIYYINDIPHIGHAYTTIAADVLARYYKKLGREVFFMTGTDEHGAKIAEAAEKAGKSPKEFVDGLVPKFKTAWEKLNIEYDEFFRTTNKEHEKIVQEIVQKLKEKGYLEKREYEGLYCVACEKFYMPDELIKGKLCPDHKREVIKYKEENYFFLLSKLSEKLIDKIKTGELKIGPETRKNEILSKINSGLDDVSISRAAVDWGIPFPGDPEQTVYVWVDALLNYYTATKIYKNGPSWPADLHLLAKDILWFHAIVWPAMLIALDIKPPKMVFAHGFFTVDGQKMSKSIGNVLDPIPLVDKYGADAVRYALLREFPFGQDGDISEEKIAQRHTSDLANGLGNLLNRTLSMINRYELKVKDESMKLVVDGAKDHQKEIHSFIENLNFSEALFDIWTFYIKPSNELIDKEKPWELIKNDMGKTTAVLQYCYSNLISIQEIIYPFMPETAEKMKKQLETKKPEPLFPRIEEKQ
ncbi:MAG: methionine--tRNA ligase [Patescibacteria group bacterium]|nr:methionine--tRNA ligase [Patescibacteria group bacterium]